MRKNKKVTDVLDSKNLPRMYDVTAKGQHYLNSMLKDKYFLKKDKEETLDYGNIVKQLLKFTDYWDVAMVAVGTLLAVVSGVLFPLTALIFGSMTTNIIKMEKSISDPRYFKTDEEIMSGDYAQNMSALLPDSDFISRQDFVDILWSDCTIYFYAGVIAFVFFFFEIIFFEFVNMKQISRMRQVFFAQAMRQDLAWYDRLEEDVDLSTRLTDDAERVKAGLGAKLPLLISALTSLIAGLCVGFYKNWKLSLIAMCGGPVLLVASAIFAKMSSQSAVREQLRYGVAGGISAEVFSSLKIVVSFGNQKSEIQKFTKAVEDGKNATKTKYHTLAACAALSNGFIYVIYAAVLAMAGYMIALGEIDPGIMFAVLMSVVMGALGIGNSLPTIGDIATSIASSSNLFYAINSKSEIDPYSTEGKISKTLKGEIAFKDVYFSYPTRQRTMVLRGLSFVVPSGKVVALVGSSGSGKSTIINMILRFYDTMSGEVEIDGTDVREYNVNGLRQSIGLVSQEPVLFDVSIEENIRFGKPDATEQEIRQAANLANAHSFIEKLPNGYQTLVGERGTMLSGGQKQRIAIARAMVRDPKILLLDEATSALDTESEKIVQEALENAMRGRTTIIIAHRLSTVRNADTIHVMKKGEIVESGTHEELIKSNGVYYSLVHQQEMLVKDLEQKGLLSDNDTSEANGFKRSHYVRISTRNPASRKSSVAASLIGDKSNGFTVGKLLSLSKPWMTITAVSLCSLYGLIQPAFSLIYGQLIRACTVPTSEIQHSFMYISIYLVILAACGGIVISTTVLCASFTSEDMIAALRARMFHNILSQDMSYFDHEETSPMALTSTLALNPPQIKAVAGMRAALILITAVNLIATFVITYTLFWQIGVLFTCLLPIVGLMEYLQARQSILAFGLDDEATVKATKMASECFSNVKTVQFLCLQEFMTRTFAERISAEQKEERKSIIVYAIAFAVTSALQYFVYGGAYIIGGQALSRGENSPQNLYTCVTTMITGVASIGVATLFVQDFGKCKVSIFESFKIMSLPKLFDPFCSKGEKPTEIRGNIEFKDVHFSYPTRKNVPVLRGFNLTVKAGQTVALVGGSGCGKSTTIGLLERFYQPNSGSIYLDGTDIKFINVDHLRHNIGLVTQEPVLFDTTIRENIAYGAKSLEREATEEEIVEAAKRANIHDFITSLPMGYETKVGDRGSNLSGGQKQRVAIARALVRNPKILFLDEATSALDTESEKVVQEALDKASEGRTSIVIAHRLATVRDADVIVVLHEGRVVEQGTHDELKNLKGKYYDLLLNQ